ncbi:MAG: glycogen/starch synthase [bacterium]|nr:glycogen/starch synthase [bacterium]
MRKKIKVAQIAAEIEPFSKSGGLANVMGSLPKTEAKLGANVIVITPGYGDFASSAIGPMKVIFEDVNIEVTSGIFEKATYLRGFVPDTKIPIYFVSNKKYFGNDSLTNGKIYGAKNDNARFLFFDVAALELLKLINWKPDIIHCHDWHTGLIPYFLKGRYKKNPFWTKTACLFTIHNLVYQLGHDWWLIPDNIRDDGRTPLPSFAENEAIERINFVKRAILNADAINTVSETYREEIMTRDFGEDLHRILKNRENRIFGIINGIDYNEYNPLTDPGLYQHYNARSSARKRDNKIWLQKHYGLKKGANTPLSCMTSRIVEQKGFALLLPIIGTLMEIGMQIIIMGDGDEEIAKILGDMQKNFPEQFVYTRFDSARETSLYAGSDIFILPSRFEPCGVNQLIALRYGCIPVVHHIGGLADTITNFDPRMEIGNGFTFAGYDPNSLLVAMARANETYKHKDIWRHLVVSGLREANSWIIPTKKYIELYKTTLKLRKARTKLAER